MDAMDWIKEAKTILSIAAPYTPPTARAKIHALLSSAPEQQAIDIEQYVLRPQLLPQAYEFLKLLATRPNQLVRKSDIISKIWSGRYIDGGPSDINHSIRVMVWTLRKALNDSDLEIITKPGVGYVLRRKEDAPKREVITLPSAEKLAALIL